jgi:preprotein translocase subunit YajC
MFAPVLLLADAQDAAPKGPSPTALDPLMMLLIFAVPLIFFIVLPARREARARREMLSHLKKGDRVVLNGFLIATVLQITKSDRPQGEDELLVKGEDNAKWRVLRGSVTRILKSEETKEGS